LAKKSGNLRIELNSASADLALATVDGRLEEVTNQTEQIWKRGDEANISYAGVATAYNLVRVNIYLGLPIESISSRIDRAYVPGVTTLGLAYSGRTEEANKNLDSLLSYYHGPLADAVPAAADITVLEASVLAGNKQAAEMMLERLAGSGVQTSGAAWITCTARHLGGAAALLGRPDEARRHYQEAIRVCMEMRFRPELALTRLQLAELLLDHYSAEKKGAIEHLDFAIREFREMKMQPSLERALRSKEILKA